MSKLRVGLLFGGRSVEHEVSIASATSILQALDRDRYEVSLIAIDPAGHWHLSAPPLVPETSLKAKEVTVPIAPGSTTLVPIAESLSDLAAVQLDVLFPIVHGRGGEDGALQGLLDLAEIPYVGSGVLGSAVQMDKDVAKRLLAAANLPVVPWRTLSRLEVEKREVIEAAAAELGFPVFVKPANSGSSVGIHKADDVTELIAVVADAARYDTKVLIERAVDAREIEVAVIGNDTPEASVPGEICSSGEFYDYESKYVDNSTELLIPAELEESQSERLRSLALESFGVLGGTGMARVDFLVERHSGEVFINELNSLPGFTDASMFPLLWEATGLPYSQLLDRLIELALERHAIRAVLETSRRQD
jgi:D-alanine-D-alanine ligase